MSEISVPTISMRLSDFILMEGIAKTGNNAGQPFSFAKLDAKEANDPIFIKTLKDAGVRIIACNQAQ